MGRGSFARLFDLLEQINSELEHGVGIPEEIRILTPEEVSALLRFARDLGWSARKLDKVLRLAGGEVDVPRPLSRRRSVSGIIDSLDHPVLRMLEEQRRQDRERAARICRRGIREVTADDLLPYEIVCLPRTSE